jgi:general stress protein YciG
MANQNSRQDDQDNNSGTSTRGFASMDPDRVKEIASMGGRAAHASGNAHEFTSEEARDAGVLHIHEVMLKNLHLMRRVKRDH